MLNFDFKQWQLGYHAVTQDKWKRKKIEMEAGVYINNTAISN